MRVIIFVFLCLLGLQVAWWNYTRHIMPSMDIVPDVPGVDTVKALSLGDEHAYFRLLALQLQSAGDTFGRFTALKLYDFNKLYHWFSLLDKLDARSNHVPAMAGYYFSQTQNTPDVRYVVDYLIEHAQRDIQHKWWWATQAVYLANHKLKDKDLALKAAKMLEGVKGIPMWAQQLPALVHEQRGEMEDAKKIIENILKSTDELSQSELNYMRYFVEERIERLDEMEKQLNAAQKKLSKREKHKISSDKNPKAKPKH